jgi:hypothetical protein
MPYLMQLTKLQYKQMWVSNADKTQFYSRKTSKLKYLLK